MGRESKEQLLAGIVQEKWLKSGKRKGEGNRHQLGVGGDPTGSGWTWILVFVTFSKKNQKHLFKQKTWHNSQFSSWNPNPGISYWKSSEDVSKETLAELTALGAGFLAMSPIPLVLSYLYQEFVLGRICGVPNWEELGL